MEEIPDSRNRWALLIGIDRYPKLSSRWQLEGCVNDVQIMRDALLRRFDFRENQIDILLNEQATRDGILAAMEDLVRRVGQDDIVVIHYSGHGSQQPDGPEADEPDGMDETLVPHDSGRLPQKSLDISDDVINAWLQRLTARTPYVTLIFDCCHSGTITRGKTRSIPEDGPHWLHLESGEMRSVRLRSGKQEESRGWLPFADKYVLFAACTSEETAAEITVGEPVRVAHGALTYYLVQELMAPALRRATCQEIFERLALRLTEDRKDQHPQLEGARHREVFGVSTVRPMSYLPILSRQGDRVILGAGDVCGMTVGSRWLIYPQGTRSEGEETRPLGTVEILTVGVTASEARILDEVRGESIGAGNRAVEEFRCLKGAGLDVEILAPPGHPSAAALSRRIARSKLIRQVGPGGRADARVHLLRPGTAARKRIHGSQELSEEIWAALDENDDNLLMPPFACSHPQAIEAMAENLEMSARLRGVVSLQPSSSSLAELIDFDLYRREGDQVIPPLEEDGERVFHDGDSVVLEIHNRAARHVYVYMLDIGLTGRVAQVYPDRGAQELLVSRQSVRIGAPPSPELRLFMPEDFASLQRARGRAEIEGRETLKLFASTSKADFGVLEQPGMRFRTGAAMSLNEVLAVVFGGGGYRAFTSGQEDWTAVQKTFRLRARVASEAVV